MEFECVLIDPTERAFKHYEEVKLSSEKRKAVFSGDIQPDYINTISKLTPDFSKFTFINKGLWSKKGDLKFYKPLNDKYVSHTFIENMYSKDFTVVETDTLRNIMNSLGHTHIDLLKLDIEGAENTVLKNMIDTGIFPSYLCIEFDLKLKRRDFTNETDNIIELLEKNNYIMLDNENWNCLFRRI